MNNSKWYITIDISLILHVKMFATGNGLLFGANCDPVTYITTHIFVSPFYLGYNYLKFLRNLEILALDFVENLEEMYN